MLIAMAVFDTPENNRTPLTERTLSSLAETVDFTKHRLVISDNGSCFDTHHLYDIYHAIIDKLILNGSNIGTANAINRAWYHRDTMEHAVKMDNDVVFERCGWADCMEVVFYKSSLTGICGLKRKDLLESPITENEWYRSKLEMLAHADGEPWIIVEAVKHVMGTCQAYNAALLNRMGYLYQPGVYGFDDALASARAHKLCYDTVFLHGYGIDHIDPGGDEYTKWKRYQAGLYMDVYHKMRQEYESGTGVYYDGGPELARYRDEWEEINDSHHSL